MKGINLAIFAPKSPQSSAHVANICDAKEIPYIDTYADIETRSSKVNVYPSQEILSQMLIDVVNASEWQEFTILYEAPTYVKRVARLLEERNNRGFIAVQPLEVGSNFRNVLKRVKEMGSRSMNIIIECSIERLSEILEQVYSIAFFNNKLFED